MCPQLLFCCAFKHVDILGDAWLAQLEDYVTLDLWVMGLSPTLCIEITKKKKNTHTHTWIFYFLRDDAN